MDERHEHVIGRELADATEADARRLAGDPPPSPLPPGRYEPDQLRLYDPVPVPLDQAMAGFVRAYRDAPPEVRAQLRDGIGLDDAYRLLSFARRATVFALRSNDADLVSDGLCACAAIASERVDQRDCLVAIGLLHHAAIRCGADPAELMPLAARLGTRAFIDLVEGFLSRSGAQRDLRAAWGHVEVDAPHGVGLLRCGYASWQPTLDLVGTSLQVADALRTDDYAIEDPELAVEMPAYWLSETDDRALAALLGAARGASVTYGRLRPNGQIEPASQMFTAWLVELDDAAAADHLVLLARTPPPGTSLLAMAHGSLFFLLVARSVVQGVDPYERGDDLERFRSSVRVALQG
jgi:hypothetical protein